MALTPEDVVNQKFTITKFRDGYDLDQVDDFLDTIVEELRQHEQEKAALQAQIDELKAGGASAGSPDEEKAELRAQVDDLKAKLSECEATVAKQAAEAEQGAADAADVSEQTIVVEAPAPVPAAAPASSTTEVASGPQPDAVKSSAMLQLALELHDKHVKEGETTRDRLIREAEQTRDQMIDDAERTAKHLVEEAQQQRAEELRMLGEERGDLQFKIKELRQFESEYRSTLRSYIQSQLRGLDGSPEPAGAPDGLQ